MTEEFTAHDFFPYSMTRDGQDEMMRQIEKAVRAGSEFLAEAPNGFGKTCVTLCGVLPWVKENNGKILYCARTHRQLDRVIEELTEMSQKIDVTGVSFRGRNHMCLNEFVLKNAGSVAPVSEVCRQLKTQGKCVYYEYIRNLEPEDVFDDMPFKVMTAPDIVKVGKIRSYCPYELAKLLAKVVDVVALSYLYVFDPFIMEVFLPELDTHYSKLVLVEDEAHNVPSTALDSASDSLTIGIVRAAMREATTYNDAISRKYCRELARLMLATIENVSGDGEVPVDPRSIYDAAVKVVSSSEGRQPVPHMSTLGRSIQKSLLRAGKFPRSTIFRVAEFMKRWLELADREDYTNTVSSSSYSGGRRVSLDLIALDPTRVTNPILSMVHSTVAVSGTIAPLDAYSEMIGFDSSAVKSSFSSPFARSNRVGLIVEGIDTSYKRRSEGTFRRMVEHCVAVAHSTPGNTGIFTTSYAIAKSLARAGLEKKLTKKLFLEKSGMKSIENDRMIAKFREMGDGEGAVLLGVQGGRNSEGGDFPGHTMNSVVVVGVPYARPTHSIKALIEYYNKRFDGRGQDYAYVMPAMTRAVQAAGRPVRRLDDKGAIILLDQRFASGYLRRFMPSWLREVTEVVPDDPELVRDQIEGFFAR